MFCRRRGGSGRSDFLRVIRSGSFIEFFYTRNKLAMAELSYDVQWTDDLLATWDNSGITESILSDNGAVQQVKALVPKGTTDGRFVRLKVTRQ